MFNPIIQQYESRTVTSLIKVATMKNIDDLCYAKEEAIMC